ncbi:MAG: DUF4430 domain-containing protein [Baekduia sp.]
MKKQILGLLVGGFTLAMTASPAMAASVSVEIEGQAKILAPTIVTTPSSVNKDGTNSCDGNTAMGALDAATGGNWSGSYSLNSYSVETVLGESHPFGTGAYWTFYVNGNYANAGPCGIPVQDNDKILFYAGDNAFVDGQGGFDEPVLLTAPATAKPGVPFTVTARNAVTTFDSSYTGTTHFEPAAGATVQGGTATVTTGADGSAQVTVPSGPYALVVTNANRAPGRISGCATTGTDGACGSTQLICPAGSNACGTPPPAPCFTTGSDGFCGSPDKVVANAAITAVTEGKKYKKGAGPRELSGKVANDGSGIADVRLRLTRTDGRKCATYDGKTEKFRTLKKCGAAHGVWFSVGAKQEFTYLLPSKLGRGRYVLDVEVTDKAGNTTKSLARGTSRVVFFVA